KSVAVVGSGPAGLAAAYQLNQFGYDVTVLEKNEAAGGLLRYGIPNFKLNKKIIDRRISILEEEGIKFRYNETVSDASKLASEFDAVVIATGTPQARDLKAPGRELKGIHLALELLSQQNRVLAGIEIPDSERVSAKDKNVLVIGGGDTGSDCIGTAHRQGCKSVTQIEIMPKPPVGHNPNTPWPNWPVILKTTSSHEEGCERRWLLNTNKFIGDKNSNVKEVEVEGVEWLPNPEGGRPIMQLNGKKEIIKADLVLLAMGFLKPEHPEYPANVFTCGDAASGASLVVRAIASGLDTARRINDYLNK
ncbi:MAG: FAD-dependent oxidoreductase, partial [Paludibacteraceae bacterium]|nr:FAD-dependent oxidoreductase [Paludibacteraceae bacterium]